MKLSKSGTSLSTFPEQIKENCKIQYLFMPLYVRGHTNRMPPAFAPENGRTRDRRNDPPDQSGARIDPSLSIWKRHVFCVLGTVALNFIHIYQSFQA